MSHLSSCRVTDEVLTQVAVLLVAEPSQDASTTISTEHLTALASRYLSLRCILGSPEAVAKAFGTEQK